MKDRVTAALLAFFLGAIGVHRFYLGQTGLGFLYLLFFWTLIPALISLIDFICFLTSSDASFNSKYNRKNMVYREFNYADQRSDSASEIQKLYDLKEKGVLTEAEFQESKRRLLR
ncbi:NINE protein [Sphingobacterium sp. MYb382]|uniref:NINE protein n=1 Tax=Sphingobacterium sp. MYb382 TaxID=2745278 RepID=UPI0030AF77F2